MKTITLDDVAYNRLKSWKRNSSESFSSVVKRVLPEPGSLGAFLAFVERKKIAQLPANDILEHVVEERLSAKNDPWI